MIATVSAPSRDWRVVIRVQSDRRAAKAWPTLADEDAPAVGDEPVVDVLTVSDSGPPPPTTTTDSLLGTTNASSSSTRRNGGMVAVAVSDVTGEVLTAMSKQLGVSHDVLRYEFDDVLGFSSNDDGVLRQFAPSIKRALHRSQNATCVSFSMSSGESRGKTLWGTELDGSTSGLVSSADVKGSQEGYSPGTPSSSPKARFTPDRHGGLFLRTISMLLSSEEWRMEANHSKEANIHLSCSFVLVPESASDGFVDLLSSRSGSKMHLRAIARQDHTVIPGLSEHAIESVSSGAALVSQAISEIQQLCNEGRTPGPKKCESRSDSTVVARLYIDRSGQRHVSAEALLNNNIVMSSSTSTTSNLRSDALSEHSRTVLTFVDMGGERHHGKSSSSSSASAAFLRCVAASVDGKGIAPCRDSPLTLMLKGTFMSRAKVQSGTLPHAAADSLSNNLFIAHLDCSGGATEGSVLRPKQHFGSSAENRSKTILTTLKYASRVLQSAATVNLNSSFFNSNSNEPSKVHGTAVVLSYGGPGRSHKLTAMSAMKSKLAPLSLSGNSLWNELAGSRLLKKVDSLAPEDEDPLDSSQQSLQHSELRNSDSAEGHIHVNSGSGDQKNIEEFDEETASLENKLTRQMNEFKSRMRLHAGLAEAAASHTTGTSSAVVNPSSKMAYHGIHEEDLSTSSETSQMKKATLESGVDSSDKDVVLDSRLDSLPSRTQSDSAISMQPSSLSSDTTATTMEKGRFDSVNVGQPHAQFQNQPPLNIRSKRGPFPHSSRIRSPTLLPSPALPLIMSPTTVEKKESHTYKISCLLKERDEALKLAEAQALGAQQRLLSFMEEYRRLDEKLAAQSKENLALSIANRQMQEEVDRLITERQTEREVAATNMLNRKSEWENEMESRKRMEQRNEALRAEVAELREQNVLSSKKLTEAEEAKNVRPTLESENLELRTKIEQLRGEMTNKDASIAAVTKREFSVREDLDRSEQLNQGLSEKVSELSTQLNEMMDKLKKMENSVESKCQDAVKRRESELGKIHLLEIKNLRDQIEGLKEQENSTTGTSKQDSSIEKLKDDLRRLKEEYDKAKVLLKESAEIEDLKGELHNFKNLNADMLDLTKEHKQKVNEMVESIGEMQSTIEKLTKEKSGLEHRINNMASALEKTNSENRELKIMEAKFSEYDEEAAAQQRQEVDRLQSAEIIWKKEKSTLENRLKDQAIQMQDMHRLLQEARISRVGTGVVIQRDDEQSNRQDRDTNRISDTSMNSPKVKSGKILGISTSSSNIASESTPHLYQSTHPGVRKADSHDLPSKTYFLAGSDALENKLQVIVRERDDLRRKLQNLSGVAKASSQNKKQVATLLQNVTILFAKLEGELASKFRKMDLDAANAAAQEQERIKEMELEIIVLQDQLSQCASDLEEFERQCVVANRESTNLRGEKESLKRQLHSALANVAALKESEAAAYQSLKTLRSKGRIGLQSRVLHENSIRKSVTSDSIKQFRLRFQALLRKRYHRVQVRLKNNLVKKLKSLTFRRSLKSAYTSAGMKLNKSHGAQTPSIHVMRNAFVELFIEKVEQVISEISDSEVVGSSVEPSLDSDFDSDDDTLDANDELFSALEMEFWQAETNSSMMTYKSKDFSRVCKDELEEARSANQQLQAQVHQLESKAEETRLKLTAQEGSLRDNSKEISRLRRQRNGLKKMFDKSQAVVKKTLGECRRLYRELQETKSRASVGDATATAAAQLDKSNLRQDLASQVSREPLATSPPAAGRDARQNLIMSLASIRGQLQGFAESFQLIKE